MKYILYYSLFLSHFLFAQEEQSAIKIKIELAGAYSYTGINGLVGINIAKKKNEWGIGVRSIITNFSKFNHLPFIGVYIDYNRNLAENKKLKPLLNLYYGNLFRKLNDPVDNKSSLFQIHEIYIGYGLSYKMGKINILNTINYGGYMERQINFYKDNAVLFFHHGPMIKLSIKYEF